MIITWNNFEWFAISAIVLWLSGALFALFSKERSRWAILLTLLGITVFAVFIAGFWLNLHRPPLRTMGETRLWYSFFMGISGLLTYIRWKYPWILCFSTVVGAVFAIISFLIQCWDAPLSCHVWDFSSINPIIWKRLTSRSIQEWPSLLSECLQELSGRKPLGGITGAGTLKRLGQQ